MKVYPHKKNILIYDSDMKYVTSLTTMTKTGLIYPIKNKHILFRHDFDGQSYGLMNDTKKKA